MQDGVEQHLPLAVQVPRHVRRQVWRVLHGGLRAPDLPQLRLEPLHLETEVSTQPQDVVTSSSDVECVLRDAQGAFVSS